MGKPQICLVANPKANTSLTLLSLVFHAVYCNAQRLNFACCASVIHNDQENVVAWPIALGFAGIGLGLTWNVLVLIPVTAGLLIVFGIIALINGVSLHDAFNTVVLPIVSVQAGYMVGLRGRELLRPHAEKQSSSNTERV